MSLINKRIISLNTDSGTGGSYLSLLPVLKELKRQGANVLVIIPKYGNFSKRLEELNIDFILAPTLTLDVYPEKNNIVSHFIFLPKLLKRIIFHFISFIQILYISLKFKPDLIHTNNSLTNVGAEISRLIKIPHIYHIREYGMEDFGWHRFPSEIYFNTLLQSSFVIAITNGLYNRFNIIRGRIIYNGIMSKNIYKANNRVNDYFLYVGTLSQNKGINQLLHAFSSFTHEINSKTNLILLGNARDSIYKQELNNLIVRLGLQERVILKGYVNDVSFYMKSAKAVIVPSLFEGFGRTVAEAMFSGTIVIGHDKAGIKEQFDIGLDLIGEEIGLRYNTVNELTNQLKIAYNLTDPMRLAITRNAFKVVNDLYTVESCAQKTCEYLNNILI